MDEGGSLFGSLNKSVRRLYLELLGFVRSGIGVVRVFGANVDFAIFKHPDVEGDNGEKLFEGREILFKAQSYRQLFYFCGHSDKRIG